MYFWLVLFIVAICCKEIFTIRIETLKDFWETLRRIRYVLFVIFPKAIAAMRQEEEMSLGYHALKNKCPACFGRGYVILQAGAMTRVCILCGGKENHNATTTQ